MDTIEAAIGIGEVEWDSLGTTTAVGYVEEVVTAGKIVS